MSQKGASNSKILEEQLKEQSTTKFKAIKLLRTETLGIGSYGCVCKVVCDDLLCAAKILHPTLLHAGAKQTITHQREYRLPIERFLKECEFMSTIRHPNIVQYLGTHQDPETGSPVLLMELIDQSLTSFLDNSMHPVPYHTQVNFCHDICIATSYLHSNGIIHRDLSSNNVLLYNGVKAKVTDFGMATLSDINPHTRVSFTMCPGTDAYMPPEAVKDPPVYTAMIDSFSIGALIIQVMTRQFPKPGARHKMVHTIDPQFPTIEVRVSEVERRQNHISIIDPNHPLLQIALDCLKDNDVERPSAQELCHRLTCLKVTPQYTESNSRAHQLQGKEGLIRKLQEQIEEMAETMQNEKESKIDQLRQHVLQVQELNQTISTQNNRLREDYSNVTQQHQGNKVGLLDAKVSKTKEQELQDLFKEAKEEAKRAMEWVRSKEDEIRLLQKQLDDDHKLRNDLLHDKDSVIMHREQLLQEQIAVREKMEIDFQRTIKNLSAEIESLTERLLWYRESEENSQDGDVPQNTINGSEQHSSPMVQNPSEVSPESQEQTKDSAPNITRSELSPQNTPYNVVTLQQPLLTTTQLYQPWQTDAEDQVEMETRIQDEIKFQGLMETPLLGDRQSEEERQQEKALLFNQVKYIGTPPESVDDQLSVQESDKIEMIMRDGENAPRSIMRGSSVVDGNIAYYSYGTTIFSYDSDNEEWSILQTNDLRFSSLEMVQGLLTTIGGRLSSTRETTDKLLSLVNELGTHKWVETFPPMPTKRCYTVTANTGKELVVAGGSVTGRPEEGTTVVEVMDIQSLTWCTAISLPMPITNGSMSICGEDVYIVGGKIVLTLALHAFTNTFSLQTPLTERLIESLTHSLSLTAPYQEVHVWTRQADIPVHGTTCASVNGQLLAVGGVESEGKVSAAIYKYDRDSDCWEVITHMAVPRYNCHTAVLSSNELMVVGGCTRTHHLTNSVEIAQVL